MILHRLLAFAILVLEAGLLGYFSRHWTFPIGAILAALAGCAGLWYRRVPKRTKALVIFVGLPLIFVRWGSDSSTVAAMLDTATAMQGIARFIIWAQLIDFFLIDDAEDPTDRRGGWSKPPWALPFSGVVVITALSSGVQEETQQIVYITSSALYVALFVAYYALPNTARKNGRTRIDTLSAALASCAVVLLACGLALGVASTVWVHSNLAAIDSYLNHLIFPDRSGSAMGFSRDATLGTIRAAKGSDSEKIAVRVVASEKPGYMRACAFDNWEGTQWRPGRSGVRVLQPDAAPPPSLVTDGSREDCYALRPGMPDTGRAMRIWPRTEMSGTYLAPLATAWIGAQDRGIEADESLALGSSSGGAQQPYRVLAGRGDDEWPGAGALSPEMRERCTSVPETIHADIRVMATAITRNCSTSFERVRAIERHLRLWKYNFGIVVPRDRNPLEYFLLEKPPAHCEYFASGAAILLRLSGVPCRYVTGFVVSERNALGGHWVARNRDAHAWVEAWDDGDPVSGRAPRWVTVDATPPDGVPGGGGASLLDSLWDQATFLIARIRTLLRESGVMGLPKLVGMVLAAILFTPTGQLGIALILVVLLVLRLLRRRVCAKPPLPADLKALHRALRTMDRFVARWGVVRGAGETLFQFADRLAAENAAGHPGQNAADWYRSYVAVRYSLVRDAVEIERLTQRAGKFRPF